MVAVVLASLFWIPRELRVVVWDGWVFVAGSSIVCAAMTFVGLERGWSATRMAGWAGIVVVSGLFTVELLGQPDWWVALVGSFSFATPAVLSVFGIVIGSSGSERRSSTRAVQVGLLTLSLAPLSVLFTLWALVVLADTGP